MNPVELLNAMKRTVEQLAAYNEIARALTSTLEMREVLALVMQKVSQLLTPESWSLLLEGPDGQLGFEICVGPASEGLKGLRIPKGEGIAGAVFASGQARLVADVREDPDFSTRFDLASKFQTRSVVAVPLVARGKVLGVIELVNGEGAPGFSDDDLRALSAIADYAAIAIENARNFRRVQELTLTDEHTGLFNARHLTAELEREVARSERFQRPVSLIFLDLDHFKRINDSRGHLVGSATLRAVGKVISAQVRGVDLAFRYGGDEFAILLLETSVSGAISTAERLRKALQEGRFNVGGGPSLALTASFGLATFPDHAGDARSLLEAADQAMYAAKHAGRNRVALAKP